MSLLQSLVSRDTSEIILIWYLFFSQDTFMNRMFTKHRNINVFYFDQFNAHLLTKKMYNLIDPKVLNIRVYFYI